MATVKLSNNVLLSSSSLQVGIDINNIIATASGDYIATQDCFVRSRGNGYQLFLKIDDNYVLAIHNQWGGNGELDLTFFVRKGQKVDSGGTGSYTVFGVI